ncbi:MAG: hypothetical protein HQL88_00740 [Magnetococcales bacterium]|nr:hypothetical protein [Magnetococcales bacterium]
MLEKFKNKRTLMIAGAALLAILLLVVGYRLLFGSSRGEEEGGGKVKGAWVPNAIPDLPPLIFDPQKDWGAPAVQLAQLNAASRARVKAGVRIEKGRSSSFDDELIVIEQLQVDKSVAEWPRIRIALRYNGDRVIDEAKLDVLFLDSKATLLARRAINPLVVSGSMFGDKMQPLHPGELRNVVVDATQAPLGWLDRVSVELIYYRYAP